VRYLVCYDISEDRRRQRLVDVLLDYGTRVEESVFECVLEASLAEQMIERIHKAVDTVEDKVLVYGLCESCADKVQILGPVERPAQAEFYIL
jgi:CRISPR-associated protein Cas2